MNSREIEKILNQEDMMSVVQTQKIFLIFLWEHKKDSFRLIQLKTIQDQEVII